MTPVRARDHGERSSQSFGRSTSDRALKCPSIPSGTTGSLSIVDITFGRPDARQVLLASSDAHGGDQPAARQADHAKRSIGLCLVLSPNLRARSKPGASVRLRVVRVGVVLHEGLERLAGRFVDHPSLDHDSALQADVERDRIEPRRIGDFDARGEIRLSLGWDGNDLIASSLGQADQPIAAFLVRGGLDAVESMDGKLGRSVATRSERRPVACRFPCP